VKKFERCQRCAAKVRPGGIDLTADPIHYDLPFGKQGHSKVCRACIDELVVKSQAPEPAPKPAKVVGYVKREHAQAIGRKTPRYRKYSYSFTLEGTVKKGKCVAADPADGHPEHHWKIVRYKNWGNYRYCGYCFPRTGKLFRVNTSHDGKWDNTLFFTKAQRRQLGAQV